MPEANDQIEFLFTGNLSDLNSAFKEVDAKQDAMVVKAATAQSKIQQEYGITSNIINRQGTETAQLAQKAVASSSTITGAQRVLQAEYGITSEIIKRQARELASTIPMAQSGLDKLRSQFTAQDPQAAARAFTPDPARASGISIAAFRMEEQLASDRLKWAGQHAASEETIRLFLAARTKANNVAASATEHLAAIERKAAAATTDAGTAASQAALQFAGLGGNTGVAATAMTALISPAGLVVVGLAAIVATGAAAAYTLFSMATGAATFADDLTRTNAQTGLSYNTILALKTAAGSAHVSFQSLISSVGILEKRLGNMDTANDRISKGLKKWGIDAKDPDKALEQIIGKLGQFPEGIQRTQVAMDVFGIGGKAFAAITKEMHGNLVTYREELERMGIAIVGGALDATNKFNEAQVKLGIQWEVIKFKIQEAATPIVENWLKGISGWMTTNQNQIIEWGNYFTEKLASVTEGVKDLYTWLWKIKDFSPLWIEINIIRKISTVMSGLTGANVGAAGTNIFGANPAYGAAAPQPNYDEAGEYVGGRVPGSSAVPENPFARESRGGGGGGGADPMAHAMKMEQERLKQTIAGYQHEQQQWESMFQKKQISIEAFTIQAINLEVARSRATMDGLQREYDAASRLKKPAEREEKQLAIVGRMAEEKYRLQKAGDDRIEALDKENLSRYKAREEGLYSIFDATARQEEERATDLARHRIITEEDAARQIIAIQMNLMRIRKLMLEGDLANEKEGSSEYIRIKLQLGRLETETASANEAGVRRIKASRDNDLEDARRFVADIIGLDQDIIASRINLTRGLLEHSIATGGMNDPNDQRDARASLERAEENARYEQLIFEIHEKLRIETKDQTWERIRVLNDRYLKIAESAEAAHIARLKIIDEQRLVDLHSALGQLSGIWANNISNSIAEGFDKGIGAGVKSFGRGLLEMAHGVAMRELQKQLLAIFDNLAGRGGIIGKLFEIITGVKKGKSGADDAVGGLGTIAGSGADVVAKESSAALAKVTSSITVAGAQQTQELILAGATRTREITATIQAGIEHLCACNKPAQQGLLSTLLQAAIGGAISGAVGGSGGGRNNESGGTYAGTGMDTGTPQLVSFVPQPGYYEGGNFGENESFMVGEKGPEKVYTNERGGFVVPMRESSNSSEGAKQINITLNAPVLGSSSHSAPRSRREYLEMLAPALRDALNA